jgi:outer membrane protein assembly factor BamB
MNAKDPRWVTSGDAEIDALRRDAIAGATNEDNYAYRVAMLTTWSQLLQCQGYDLEAKIPAEDALVAALRRGSEEDAFAAVDDALACLERIQSQDQPLPDVPGPGRPSDPSATGRDWPVYGGDPHHTACTNEAGPMAGQIAWTFPAGLAWYSRPLVEDGRVYAACPGMRGLAYCLDLATGRTVWFARRPWTPETLANSGKCAACYVTPGVSSSVIDAGDRLVLNEYGGQSRNFARRHLTWIDKTTGGILRREPAGHCDYRTGYAALAGDGEVLAYPASTVRLADVPPQFIGPSRIGCHAVDGEKLWEFHIGATFADPVVLNGQVFVGTADGTVFCLNAHGASARQAFGVSDTRRVAWTFQAGDAVNSPVAVHRDRVVFGASDGRVHCVDLKSGAERWSLDSGATEPRSFTLFTRPTFAAGRVYIGDACKRLLCIDAETGVLLWTAEASDWMRAAPVVRGGLIFAATLDGRVHCLLDRGEAAEVVWIRPTGPHPVFADPVEADGRLLVTNANLWMFCLDAGNGETVWRRRLLEQTTIDGKQFVADKLAGGGFHQSKPTTAEGKVFIGTPSRFVFAIDHASGREVWRFELGGAVSGSPTYAAGRIFVGQQGGEEHFYCLDAETGLLAWKQSVGWVWSSGSYADRKVFTPGVDGHISCLDADTGHILWRYRTGSGSHPEPPIDNGLVYVGSWDHYVYALDCRTGKLAWRFHTGGTPDSGAPIAFEGRLYVPMGGKRLCCLDAETGTLIWEYLLDAAGSMNASPAVWKDKILISTSVRSGCVPVASRIRCLNRFDGAEIWSHPGGGITGPSVANGRAYFASTSDAFFRCVEIDKPDEGVARLVWRKRMGDRVYESVPALYAGKAFVLSEDGFLYAFA